MNSICKVRSPLSPAVARALANIAYKLAEEGCKIAICARRIDVLEATAAQIRDSTSAQVMAIAADVTRLEDLERVVSTTVETCGPMDILVNNAGRTAAHPFEQTTEAMWQEDFDLKFWAAVRTVRLVVPHMKTLGRGAIVNITHPGGKAPGPASVPTSVSVRPASPLPKPSPKIWPHIASASTPSP